MALGIKCLVVARDYVIQRARLAGARLTFRFLISDDAAPGTILHEHEEPWDYDLSWFIGKTAQQILVMVKTDGPPAPPPVHLPDGTVCEYDSWPPPMRVRAAEILAEYVAGQAAIGLAIEGQL